MACRLYSSPIPIAAAAAFVAIAVTSGLAAPPQLDYLFPAGAQRGATEIAITAGGKFDQWPVDIWTNAPDGSLTFAAASDKDEKGKLAVTVAPNCEPGAYLVRLFSNEGVSAARIFVVGTLPEELEVEPNNTFRSPQPVSPSRAARVINGRMDKRGDVDCFSIELEADQTLVAEVAAYVLDSPVDPLLHVRVPDGYRIAFNHDAPGHLLDPRLVFSAPTAGRYVLELAGFVHPPRADIRLTGSDATCYRLTLAAAPLASHTLPLAVRRGTTRAITFYGTGSPQQQEVTVPENISANVLYLDVPPYVRPVPVRLSDVPEQVEPARSIAIPSAISGVIEEPGETDRYSVVVTKDTTYHLIVEAARVRSQLDPAITIEDINGKELASNDDALHRFDSELSWKAPADGTYSILVRSRFREQSGSAFFYRLQCKRAHPEVHVTAAADAITLKPKEETEIPLNIARKHGHAAAMTVHAVGLPEGVRFSPTEIPSDAKGEWKLVFELETDLEASCQPFQLAIRESGSEHPALPVMHPLKGNSTEAGEMLINATEHLWLRISSE